ncbi:MAG: hypothetical protein ACK5WQ_07355 [Alphaproteobacteria bacterium]
MKTALKMALLVSLSVPAFAASAQLKPAVTTHAPKETGAVKTSAVAGEKDKAVDTERTVTVTVMVRQKDKADMNSSFEEVTQVGQKEGLDKMRLVGTEQTLNKDDNKKIQRITWHSATYKDKTVTLAAPFLSHIELPPSDDVKVKDSFYAQGDPVVLQLAWEALNKEDEPKKEEKPGKDGKDGGTAANSAGGGFQQPTNSNAQLPLLPQTQSAAPTVVEQDCPVRIDLQQQAAIAQSKTIIDGAAGDCVDKVPAERYPLEKDFNSACSLDVRLTDNVVYKQYTLNYFDPQSNQKILVSGGTCTPDEGNPISILATTDGCSLRHDFTGGFSYVQKRKVYTVEGLTTEVENCKDTAERFAHTETRSGCTVAVDSSQTPPLASTFARVTINRGSGAEEIRSCQPDGGTLTVTAERVPGSSPYTHDFPNRQSTLMVNWVYTDGNGVKQIALANVPSTTVFTHQFTETGCTKTFDDTTKQTSIFMRPFFNDPANGGQQLIGSCGLDSTVPYVQVAGIWKFAASQANVPVTFNDQSSYVYGVNSCLTGQCPDLIIHDAQGFSYCSCFIYYKTSFPELITGLYPGYERGNILGKKWCVLRKNTLPYTSALNFDVANSDLLPVITVGTRTFIPTGAVATSNTTYVCDQPVCQSATNLKKVPIYDRGNGTEYTDTSVSLASKWVCGMGSALLNVRE